MAKVLSEEYCGNPPKDLKELVSLPGVGYKTVNVFLNEIYHANQGIAVDTHVLREWQEGMSQQKTQIQLKLHTTWRNFYPKSDWYKVNSAFCSLCRYILKAKTQTWTELPLKSS